MSSATPILAGLVKWFNVKKGYGFITPDDGTKDIFTHKGAIKKNNPLKAVPSLGDGERVEFVAVAAPRGPEARQVTGPKGAAVKGSTHARDLLKEGQKESTSRRPTRPSPKSNTTSFSIIDVVIRTAMALAGDDTSLLQQILPALLKENNLPVIFIPANLPGSHQRTPRQRNTPAPKLLLPRPLNRKNCPPPPSEGPAPSPPAPTKPKVLTLTPFIDLFTGECNPEEDKTPAPPMEVEEALPPPPPPSVITALTATTTPPPELAQHAEAASMPTIEFASPKAKRIKKQKKTPAVAKETLPAATSEPQPPTPQSAKTPKTPQQLFMDICYPHLETDFNMSMSYAYKDCIIPEFHGFLSYCMENWKRDGCNCYFHTKDPKTNYVTCMVTVEEALKRGFPDLPRK